MLICQRLRAPSLAVRLTRLASLGRADQAGVVGGDDELGAVACIEFHEQAADVGLGGGEADVQLGCDLGVGQAEPDHGQDFALSFGYRLQHGRRALPGAGAPLAQIIDAATIFGVILALGILAMSVGLVRSEAARDLRTLTATGAAPTSRRTLTAATAGTLALTGAVTGIAGGYLAAIGFFRSNQLDGVSSLSTIPLTNLLVILVGMPLAAMVTGWLVAGREHAGMSRQPLE